LHNSIVFFNTMEIPLYSIVFELQEKRLTDREISFCLIRVKALTKQCKIVKCKKNTNKIKILLYIFRLLTRKLAFILIKIKEKLLIFLRTLFIILIVLVSRSFYFVN